MMIIRIIRMINNVPIRICRFGCLGKSKLVLLILNVNSLASGRQFGAAGWGWLLLTGWLGLSLAGWLAGWAWLGLAGWLAGWAWLAGPAWLAG